MKNNEILVPALRGHIGSWGFYSTLISWEIAVEYICTAEEIVKNKELSKMIQRQIRSKREKEIANYILHQEERFFGSLVAAVYKGNPKWHQLGGMHENLKKIAIPITENADECFGFLELTGKEKIFALDGQHRLVGIKKALLENPELSSESISVIFVAHEDSKEGLERTRRLFTTLNKKAVPVRKGEIIALDEDDVAAICTRRLVETNQEFSEEKIAFVDSNRMPQNNNEAFTTISALYDVIKLIIISINKNIEYGLPYKKEEISHNRPDNESLDKYYKLVENYFFYLKKYNPDFKKYCESSQQRNITISLRNENGGNILFRPQGFLIISKVIAKLTEKYSLNESVELASKAPCLYQDDFYSMLIWNSTNSTVVTRNEILVKDLILNSLGCYPNSKMPDLLKRFNRVRSNSEELPNI